jgi:hypothetical protein
MIIVRQGLTLLLIVLMWFDIKWALYLVVTFILVSLECLAIWVNDKVVLE